MTIDFLYLRPAVSSVSNEEFPAHAFGMLSSTLRRRVRGTPMNISFLLVSFWGSLASSLAIPRSLILKLTLSLDGLPRGHGSHKIPECPDDLFRGIPRR